MGKHLTFGAAAVLSLIVSAHGASALTVIYEDQFNRAASSTVGGGWSEQEQHADDVAINSNQLRLRDSLGFSPDAAAKSQVIDAVGYDTISVTFRWRPLDNNETNDRLGLSWAADIAPNPSTLTGWTGVFDDGNNGQLWTESTVTISAASNSKFNIMFWTDVSEDASGDTEGFRIDWVQVKGQAIGAVPLPASLPLLAAGLFGLGALRRRRRISA